MALQVTLPPEVESQIYTLFVGLAQQAIDEAKQQVRENDRYYTQAQLCKKFKWGVDKVRKYQEMGLRSIRDGQAIVFDIYDVYAFLETLKQ